MELKEIKQKFFVYRNGAVADTLRRYGLPHGVIFGLDVPRISELGREIGYDKEMADRLWADTDVRESRLLACYLYNPAETGLEKCIQLASGVHTQEEADMLAFRVLKRIESPEMLLAMLEGYREALGAGSTEQQAIDRSIVSLRRHLE